MPTRNSDLILVSELKDENNAETNWFTEASAKGLAGRCLLDAIEYLHALPKLPARFWHVVNAHAIRLVNRCLSDIDVNRSRVFVRVKPHIVETSQLLLNGRQSGIPFYGDDFWDWASVVNALWEVRSVSSGVDVAINRELGSFHKEVKKYIANGLTINDPKREWYGPATAGLAYRVLHKYLDDDPDVKKLLGQLKAQALELVLAGKYRGRSVPPYQVLWHYGQVVALFPDEAKKQAKAVANLSWLKKPMENVDKVYVLARVLQGGYAAGQQTTVTEALSELYKTQNLDRPLGYGLMGDVIKGSLNVLDALWPSLSARDKMDIGLMLDALVARYAKNNTIGFIVAIPHEVGALEEELRHAGAAVERENGASIVTHAKFRAVICVGKSISAATAAANTLILKHDAKWVIMSGVAGSLGKSTQVDGAGVQFKGADKGDIVIATSMAPFRIRDKVRAEIEAAKVPFDGDTWLLIPTDPELFRLAHAAAVQMQGELRRFYEGTIVSGTGIMDSAQGKKEVLDEFPGGLAIEEEGYVMGLVCLAHHVPYLNIRGISDRAEGDKLIQKQDTAVEDHEQRSVARLAARMAVKVAISLSERW